MNLVPDAGRLAEHAEEIRLTGKHLYREPPYQPPDVEPPEPPPVERLSPWLSLLGWGLAALFFGALIAVTLP